MSWKFHTGTELTHLTLTRILHALVAASKANGLTLRMVLCELIEFSR